MTQQHDNPPHLKEIANRMKKLSYRDMSKLAERLATGLSTGNAHDPDATGIVYALLAAADELERE